MSKKKISSEKKSFRLTPKKIIRWIIFLTLIYFLVGLLSESAPQEINLSVLGETNNLKLEEEVEDKLPAYFQSLPQEKQEMLEKTYDDLKEKTDSFKDSLNGFPQKQINQIKKDIVTEIYTKIVEEW